MTLAALDDERLSVGRAAGRGKNVESRGVNARGVIIRFGSESVVPDAVERVLAAEIPVTVPIGYSLSGDGLSVGRDTLSAVSLDYAGSNFPFTGGVIRRVTVDIGNDQHPTPKAAERD